MFYEAAQNATQLRGFTVALWKHAVAKIDLRHMIVSRVTPRDRLVGNVGRLNCTDNSVTASQSTWLVAGVREILALIGSMLILAQQVIQFLGTLSLYAWICSMLPNGRINGIWETIKMGSWHTPTLLT